MPILPTSMSIFVERHVTAPAKDEVEPNPEAMLECRLQPSIYLDAVLLVARTVKGTRFTG